MRERKEINMRIGERIQKSRKKMGYTQEKMADLIDTSIQYVSDLERGIVGASIPTLIKICSSLSTSTDYILLGHEPENHAGDDAISQITQLLQPLSDKELALIEADIKLMIEAFHLGTVQN